MLKSIIVPRWLEESGIGQAKKGFEGEWDVAGSDVETIQGEPYTLQWCPDGKAVQLFYVSRKTILPTFLDLLKNWSHRGAVSVVGYHNFRFDLQALLYDYPENFARVQRDFEIEVETVKVHAFADKNYFMKIRLSSRRMIWVIDSRAFFQSSLAKVAKMVGSPFLKLIRPSWLGERAPTDEPFASDVASKAVVSEREYFEAYSKGDVLAQYHVMRAIETLHKEYDVRLSVSLPHLGSRIFRRRFIPEGEFFMLPPRRIRHAAVLSYHGGKNQQSVPPGWYGSPDKPCHELDINSAYAHAMTLIPSFLSGEYVPVTEVPWGAHGIVCISGRVHCRYGVIFDHEFNQIDGEFSDIWVTTYELETALRHGELELTRVSGWIFESRSHVKPWKEYAEYFFALKKQRLAEGNPKGSLAYTIPKLLTNACYGKLIQTQRETKEVLVDEHGLSRVVEIWRASGLFQPFEATLITGHVRAVLHDMEHKYESLHSSTDSVKTLIKPDPADLGEELGQLNLEISGRCLLFRPKLYIHETFDERDRFGRLKVKYATHGFQGGLRELYEAGGRNPGDLGPVFKGLPYLYRRLHCYSHREASIRKTEPVKALDFEDRQYALAPVGKVSQNEAISEDSGDH